MRNFSIWSLQVKYKAKDSVKDDDWCWVEKTLKVDVGTEDIEGLKLVQKGFWMHVKSTHAVSAFILHPQNEGTNVNLKVLQPFTPILVFHTSTCVVCLRIWSFFI